MANRWNHERVAAIAATPWSVREKPVAAQMADNAEATTELTEPPQPGPMPHAFRIAYQDLVEHGFTRDCPQCEHNELHGKSRPGLSHTNPCRKRLLDALLTTPSGRQRLEAYEQRIDKAIADRGPDHEWQPEGPGSGKAAALGADGSGLVRAPANETQARLGTPMIAPETPRIDPNDHADNNDDESDEPTQYEMSDDEVETNDAEMGLLDIGHDEEAMALVNQLGMVVRQRRRPRFDRRRKYTVSEVYSLPRIT